MRAHFFRYTVDLEGNAIEAASIYVYEAGTENYAKVYTQESGGSFVNSVVSSEDGSFEFWVDSEDYDIKTQEFKIKVHKEGLVDKEFDHINIFPMTEHTHPEFGILANHIADKITADNEVHGIRRGPGKGFNADTLDGLHASEIMAGGATNISILTGVLNHGEQIPLPSGYTQAQCHWIVSPYYQTTFQPVGSSGQGDTFHHFYCRASTSRIIVCYVHMDYWSNNYYGKANYMIIGIK